MDRPRFVPLSVALVVLLGAPAGRAADPPPQQTPLTLPFAGTWGVVQGFGTGTHVGYARYALDFVPAVPRGTRPPPRGAPLSRFACFGRPVLALADGTVVRAADGGRDWPAYVKGTDAGNYVIVQHAPHEYTELRHLQAGSLRVIVGQHVSRGAVLGRCGNSGNATTPHLHVGFLSTLDPIATRPMALRGYETADASGRWHFGNGVPQTGAFVRTAATRIP